MDNKFFNGRRERERESSTKMKKVIWDEYLMTSRNSNIKMLYVIIEYTICLGIVENWTGKEDIT